MCTGISLKVCSGNLQNFSKELNIWSVSNCISAQQSNHNQWYQCRERVSVLLCHLEGQHFYQSYHVSHWIMYWDQCIISEVCVALWALGNDSSPAEVSRLLVIRWMTGTFQFFTGNCFYITCLSPKQAAMCSKCVQVSELLLKANYGSASSSFNISASPVKYKTLLWTMCSCHYAL